MALAACACLSLTGCDSVKTVLADLFVGTVNSDNEKHDVVTDGNTLRYGDHVYTVVSEIDPACTQYKTPTASVTFTNVPSGYTEFEAVYNGLLGKSIAGTAAMIPMAMEILMAIK